MRRRGAWLVVADRLPVGRLRRPAAPPGNRRRAARSRRIGQSCPVPTRPPARSVAQPRVGVAAHPLPGDVAGHAHTQSAPPWWREPRHARRAIAGCWRLSGGPGRRSIQLRMPQAVSEAGARPARSSMRSAPMPHLSAPPGPVSCCAAAANGPAHRCQDGDRISTGRDRRVRREDGPQLRRGLHQLRPYTHHSQRPVSRHVEQRLARQPVAVVQELSDRAALTRRHQCSPPTPARPQ